MVRLVLRANLIASAASSLIRLSRMLIMVILASEAVKILQRRARDVGVFKATSFFEMSSSIMGATFT